MRVLLTGATGFVGSAVAKTLQAKGQEIVPFSFTRFLEEGGRIPPAIDVCVHAAARVHVMNESADDPLREFRRSNVHATLALAREAALSGVRRFVYVSSIKVNGESTQAGAPFRPEDCPSPNDPYGISKWEAERELNQLARETGLEVVVVRPPLVYGTGVKANFEALIRLVHRALPLPLGAIRNARSMVGLENLCDFITTCLAHPSAANEVFLVSDGRDLSTPELIEIIAASLGRPARLLPVPVWMLEAAGGIVGKRAQVKRLCGSLQVDISKNKMLLDWTPPVTVEAGIAQAAQHWLNTRNIRNEANL